MIISEWKTYGCVVKLFCALSLFNIKHTHSAVTKDIFPVTCMQAPYQTALCLLVTHVTISVQDKEFLGDR